MSAKVSVAALGLTILAASSGCFDSPLTTRCTDIGCVNGLRVTFDRALEDGTVVKLDLGATPWTVTCGADVDCSEGIFYEGLRADYVGISIVDASGEQVHEVRPEYRESMPNGPDCPPTCFFAEVELEVL